MIDNLPAGGVPVERSPLPLVSIVVPFFRDAEFLTHTLRSIEAQTHVGFECLMVSDRSPDASLSIAHSFANKDKRFRVIEHQVNKGLSAARNTGLAAASGTYVQFLDGDDMLATDAIETRLRAALLHESDRTVAGSYGSHAIVGSAFRELKKGVAAPNDKAIDFYTSRGACPFVSHAPMLLREVLLRAGGFDESWTTTEDHELWYRLMRNGYRFVPSGTRTSFYRMKPRASMAVETAMQHLANSAFLQHEARLDMPEAILITGAPAPYRKPWGYYDEAVQIARRVFSFGVMADSIEDAVHSFLPYDTWATIERHVNIGYEMQSGRDRLAGHPPGQATEIGLNIVSVVDEYGAPSKPVPAAQKRRVLI